MRQSVAVRCLIRSWIIILLTIASAAFAEDAAQQFQQQWNELPEASDKEQLPRLEAMLKLTEAGIEEHPDVLEWQLWNAMVLEHYAHKKGGWGALKDAKTARGLLEDIIEQDADGVDGEAYSILALLYERTPGWPVSFGKISKAEEMHQQAVEIRQDGVGTNYHYAQFLSGLGKKESAMRHAKKAIESKPRREFKQYDEYLIEKSRELVGDKADK